VLIGFTFDAGGALAWLPPWLPERNLLAFLQHGLTYEQYRDVTSADGMSEETVTRHITFGHSALYWAVLLVVALAVSAVVFRRRDVT
jgi:ABC-2 type transport system permease protein